MQTSAIPKLEGSAQKYYIILKTLHILEHNCIGLHLGIVGTPNLQEHNFLVNYLKLTTLSMQYRASYYVSVDDTDLCEGDEEELSM